MNYCCWQVGEMEQASISRFVVSKGLEMGIRAACVGILCQKHRQLGMARAWCMGDSCRGRHLSVMLKDSNFILKAMGSYWKVLNMGTIKSFLRLGKTSLAVMQIRLKGMRQRQINSLGGCFNTVNEILI